MMSRQHRDRPVRRDFLKNQDGAVTVDWIALTAALVFMGIGAAFYIGSSVPQVADKVASYMTDYKFDE